MLLKREQRSSRYDAPIFATLVAWMYFVRPTGAIAVVAIGLLLFSADRGEFLRFAATGCAWLVSFMTYSWLVFGELLPDYYRQGSALHVRGWVVAFSGCLFSPSRGLFIFVPSIPIVIFIVARHWNTLPARRLALVAGGVIATQLILVASWPIWWGGYSYGPRLFTDLIPWFVLLAILGFRAYLNGVSRTLTGKNRSSNRQLVVAMALLLTCVSIAINGRGALSLQTWLWNERVDIDAHPERVWDLRSPQFLAGIRSGDTMEFYRTLLRHRGKPD